MALLDGFRHRSRWLWPALLWAALLLLVPREDARPIEAEAGYEQAHALFLHGQLKLSQEQAALGYQHWRLYNPEIAAKFQTLEAEAMLWRGRYQDSLAVLSPQQAPIDPEESIRRLNIEAVATTRIHQFASAQQQLATARTLCTTDVYAACGGTMTARGILAIERGQFENAQQAFLAALTFARSRDDHWLEAAALLNLGVASLQQDRLDEAVDWSKSAYRAASEVGAEDLAQRTLGNLGWAYVGLGDSEKALANFTEAEASATRLGDTLFQIKWLTTEGIVYQDAGELDRAIASNRRALKLAMQINSKEDMINSLESLAQLSIATGNPDQASAYITQLIPMVRATENRLDDLDVMLARGEIAAARHQNQQAEQLFTAVQTDPDSQTSMRLGAAHELAKLYEQQGDDADADRMYRTALAMFESARQQLENEASKLPFLANATPIYDDYIHLLVTEGKTEEALAVADHGRARTLAQGLGLDSNQRGFRPAVLRAGEIARKTDATLLFYWLGRTQSYLWAVTPARTVLIPLPAQDQIEPAVRRYRSALLGPDDPLASSNTDGVALYGMLVAPVANLIAPGSNVVILSDGPLSELNFETLIVPGAHPHYWIEDATVISAPSLYMLASAKPPRDSGRKVLILGDAVSPDQDYPELPKASLEMTEIEKHFPAADQTVFSRLGANPQSYFDSRPQQYSYIHFVAHGVASLSDPLDSAIILSPAGSAEDSFKLYAREIIQHPIHARLVTISSCYGGGTRSYAGEGMVGLSWAFLHAGAHNVIGALWEVSDDSTPQLMDSLYRRLEQGTSPSAALRQAKLELLHTQGNFRNPFYWAPFQIYTGL